MQLDAEAAVAAMHAAVACLSENTNRVRVFVDVAAGLGLAVVVFCALVCCRAARLLFCTKATTAPKSSTSIPQENEGDDSQHGDPDVGAAPSGGYRSDSSSDDEGQGARVAKLAQKRAHNCNGV